MKIKYRSIGTAGVCLIASLLTASISSVQASENELPTPPASLKEQGVLKAGVRCDYPPDGYNDKNGNPVGVEVEFAKKIAEYTFGDSSKTELHCVTAANRIPTLIGGRVDILVAALGISDKRKEVVDFSDPYTWSASTVLVPKDSTIQTMEDLSGKKVILLKGAWQIPWFEENMPDVELMKLNSVSDALQALMQDRGVAYAHDYAAQVQIIEKNNTVRMLDDRYQIGYRGIGLRKGEEELRTYINAVVKEIQQENFTTEWIKTHNDPELVQVRMDLWDVSKAPKQ